MLASAVAQTSYSALGNIVTVGLAATVQNYRYGAVACLCVLCTWVYKKRAATVQSHMNGATLLSF